MYLIYKCEHGNVFMKIKNLAYDSAFEKPNIHILPSWDKVASRFLTKIVHSIGVPVYFPQTLKPH